MTDLLSELLPEMAGEVRRWLSTIDRVRLQRVSRQLHARDPGPLLPRIWQHIAQQCVALGTGAFVFELVDTGVHDLEVPSAVQLSNTSLLLRWYQLPAACMKEGALIYDPIIRELQVAIESDSGLSLRYYYHKFTDHLGWGTRFPMLVSHGIVTLSSAASGHTFFHGDIQKLIFEGTYRGQYRDNAVRFKQADWLGSMLVPLEWNIPLS